MTKKIKDITVKDGGDIKIIEPVCDCDCDCHQDKEYKRGELIWEQKNRKEREK